jgi:hypothetical protein
MRSRRHNCLVICLALLARIAESPAADPSPAAYDGIKEVTVQSVGTTQATNYLSPWDSSTHPETISSSLTHEYPWFLTDTASESPNNFTPLSVSTILRGKLTGDSVPSSLWLPNPDANLDTLNRQYHFAARGFWFYGGLFAVAGALPPAETAPDQFDPQKPKTYIGLLSEAAVKRGGTPYDKFMATGSLNIGAAIFNPALYAGQGAYEDSGEVNEAAGTFDPDTKNYEQRDTRQPFSNPDERETGIDPRRYRRHIAAVQGTENYIVVGDSTTRVDAEGHLLDPVTPAINHNREDERWNISPAIIRRMYSVLSTAYVDNAGDGTIDRAAGVRGAIITDTDTALSLSRAPALPNSPGWRSNDTFAMTGIRGWLRLAVSSKGSPNDHTYEGFLRNLTSQVCRYATANSSSTGWRAFNYDESAGLGRIDDWVGYEVESPQYGENVDVVAKTGVYLEDQAKDSAGGSPIRVPELVTTSLPEDRALPIEKVSSFITRSHCLFEASASETKPTTINVKDVLHLMPRKGPPAFAPDLPYYERIGIIYFDAVKNALMVSMPIATEQDVLNEKLPDDAPVLWVKLKVDTSDSAIDSAKDVAGYVGTLPYSTDQEVRDAIARTDSVEYAEPRLRVTTSGTDTVTIDLTSTLDSYSSTLSAGDVYIRRAGYGVEEKGRTEWMKLSDLGATWTTLPTTPVSVSGINAKPGVDGRLGSEFPRNIIQIMVVDPTTGQATGASAWIRS